jgi:hypothetical protein
MKLGFSQQFSKNTQISNILKICPMGGKLFYVDGWMDRQTDGHTGRQT